MKKSIARILILASMVMLMLICLTSCGASDQPDALEGQTIIGEQENIDGNTDDKEVSQGEIGDVPDEGDQSSTGLQGPDGVTDKTTVLNCTLSIKCNTVFDNLDKLDPSKLEILPSDGIILAKRLVEFSEGDNVFDVLLRETRTDKIHMEFSSNPAFNSKYIEGINNLYEFDCGELSGWTYKVNGKGVGYGSSNYTLSDGDIVEWVYTCDQGRDVGLDGVGQ